MLIAWAGTARAAVTPAVPPAGAISQNPLQAPSSVTFDGTAAGTMGSGDDCPLLISTGTCSYFELDTLSSGQVEASIIWQEALDPMLENNLDLYVYECLSPAFDLLGNPVNPQPGPCQQVAASTRISGNVEFVTFQAAAGAVYELRVVPSFALTPETYSGCAGYSDGDTGFDPCGREIPAEDEEPPPPPPPPADFLADCGTGALGDRKMTGGGYISSATGTDKAHFSFVVASRHGDPSDGKVNYQDKVAELRLWGTEVTCVAYFDEPDQNGDSKPEGHMEARGRGDLAFKREGRSESRKVCWRIHPDDNGEGTSSPDTFEITIYEQVSADGTCDVGGAPLHQNGPSKPVLGGNAQYHLSA